MKKLIAQKNWLTQREAGQPMIMLRNMRADATGKSCQRRSGYLLLLSYGIPSAFGAREFLEVKARTTREIT